jgi:flagellar FliL protein
MSDARDAKKIDKADAPTAVSTAPAGSSKLMTLMVGLNSVLLVGVVAVLGLQTLRGAPHATEAASEGSAEQGADTEKKSEGKKDPEKKAAERKEGEKKGEGKKEGGPALNPGGMGPLVKIPEFVVHLRNPEVDRYARISFEVEVIGESDKDELNAAAPKVRDAIIVYLSDRTVEDLRGSEGLARAKEAMQTKLRELVPDARIRALYISDFVVQ